MGLPSQEVWQMLFLGCRVAVGLFYLRTCPYRSINVIYFFFNHKNHLNIYLYIYKNEREQKFLLLRQIYNSIILKFKQGLVP